MTLLELLLLGVDQFFYAAGSLRARLKDGTVYQNSDGIFERLVDEDVESSAV